MHAGIIFSDVVVYNLRNVAMKCSKVFMWCFFSLGSIKTVKITFLNCILKLLE
jgi:hypothetical protein